MIAKELMSFMLDPLKTSDTGHYALSVMSDFLVKHLPIVNSQQLLGMLSEDDILEHDPDLALGSYNLSLNRPYVLATDHMFDVMSQMAEFELTVIPVVVENENYLGLITMEDLLHYYARSFSFSEPGSILVLEMKKQDYSLAEIGQIVESENAAILSTFITSDPGSDLVFITLKINRSDLASILSAFSRYEYQVKATFTEEDYSDALKERYDMLMSYLNV